MTIRFRCPSGHLLSISREHAGKRLRCPKCQQAATVPAESVEAPAQIALVTASVASPAMSAASVALDEAPRQEPTARPAAVANKPALPPATNGHATPQVQMPANAPALTVVEPLMANLKKTTAPSADVLIEAVKQTELIAPPPAAKPVLKSGPPPVLRAPDKSRAAATAPSVPAALPSTVPAPPVAILPVPPVEASAVPTPPPLASAPPKIVPPPLPGEAVPYAAPVTPPPMARPAHRNPFAEDPRELAPVQFEGELQQAVDEQVSHTHRHAQTPVGYRPDRYKVQSVYLLALGLLLVTLFNAAPAARFLDLAAAPDWARMVWLMTLLQCGFIAWMVMLPDWSSVWVSMIVFAGVATLYGVALAIAVMTPHGSPVALEMDDIRQSARLWCAAVILLTCSMTYLCGRLSHRWHKSYQLVR